MVIIQQMTEAAARCTLCPAGCPVDVVPCGPGIMLKFVTKTLLDVGFKPEQIYLSMNRRMSCGIGKCGRCNIGPYYLCKDGPDMNYAKIMGYANVF